MVEERDENILKVFESKVKECDLLLIHDVYRAVAESPAERFWVTARRAYDVIKRMHNGIALKNMFPLRKEMYDEIYTRVQRIREKHPSMTLFDAVTRVIEEPAPKFYLNAMTIKNIVTSCIRKKQKERRLKRKAQHLSVGIRGRIVVLDNGDIAEV